VNGSARIDCIDRIDERDKPICCYKEKERERQRGGGEREAECPKANPEVIVRSSDFANLSCY